MEETSGWKRLHKKWSKKTDQQKYILVLFGVLIVVIIVIAVARYYLLARSVSYNCWGQIQLSFPSPYVYYGEDFTVQVSGLAGSDCLGKAYILKVNPIAMSYTSMILATGDYTYGSLNLSMTVPSTDGLYTYWAAVKPGKSSWYDSNELENFTLTCRNSICSVGDLYSGSCQGISSCNSIYLKDECEQQYMCAWTTFFVDSSSFKCYNETVRCEIAVNNPTQNIYEIMFTATKGSEEKNLSAEVEPKYSGKVMVDFSKYLTAGQWNFGWDAYLVG